MLYCGECNRREAKQVNANDIKEVSEKEFPSFAARVIRCNICAGARKRWSYGQTPDFKPLVLYPGIVNGATEYKAARDKASAERRAQENEQNRLRMVQGARRAWDEQANEYDVIPKPVEYARDAEGYLVVKQGDASRDWMRTSTIEVYRQAAERDFNFPFTLRVSTSNHMTANQARALAAALIEAANDVDEKNREVRPQE